VRTNDLFRSAKYLSIVELDDPWESPNLAAQLRKREVFPLEEVILLDASEYLESLSSSKRSLFCRTLLSLELAFLGRYRRHYHFDVVDQVDTTTGALLE
jgi:hypothetical protein